MFVNRVRLRNWCQHAAVDVELGRMTSVRGPNGSGKSNLVNALVFAFTERLRVPGDKLKNLSQFAAAGEESGVWVDFSHGGVECQLHRGLVPNRQYLKVGGGKKIVKNPEVRRELQELLGVDAALLLDYVFVEQREMHGVISGRHEERARAFAQLFGTAKAEKLWELLGETKLPEALITVNGQAVREHLARDRRDLEALKASSEVTSRQRYALEGGARDREKYLRDHSVRRLREADLAAAAPRVVDAGREAERYRELAEAAGLALRTREAETEELRARLEVARDLLSRWAAHDARAAELGRRAALLASRQRDLDGLEASATEALPGYVPESQRAAMQAQYVRRVADRATLDAFVDRCDPAAGVAACPTCGTPTSAPDLAARLEKAKATVVALRRREAEYERNLKASDEYDRLARDLDGKRQLASRRLEDARKWVAELEPLERPAEPPAEAETLRRCVERADLDVSGLRRNHQDVTREWQRCEAEERVLRDHHGLMAAQLAALTATTDEGALAAEDLQRQLREVRVADDDTRRRLVELTRAVLAEEQMLAKFEAEYRRHWQVRRARVHLEEVRRVFHRDRLPAVVSQYYLGKMTREINDVLLRFDSPFRVEKVEDLRFSLRHADGRLTPGERLSEGEKVVLSLAFRLVVNSTFAAELGLLCLDEPTAGLDGANLACLSRSLERLREVSHARGLQVLLITHEPGLDAFCDKVVELARPGA